MDSTSDLDRKESDGRDPPQESRHMPIEAYKLALPKYAGDLSQTSLPEYQVIRHIVMPSVTKVSQEYSKTGRTSERKTRTLVLLHK